MGQYHSRGHSIYDTTPNPPPPPLLVPLTHPLPILAHNKLFGHNPFRKISATLYFLMSGSWNKGCFKFYIKKSPPKRDHK